MSRKTEIQVGLTVLLAIAVLLWGIALLSAMAKNNAQRVWHVRFTQTGGLEEGNEAQVNGVSKGVVKSLRLTGDHVLVELALAKDVVLTHDSQVVIRSVSMMGDKAIVVDYHATGTPWDVRDTIPGTYEKGLPEVMADVGHATGSIGTIASQLDSLAGGMQRDGGIAATVTSFQHTAKELEEMTAENRAALRTTMDNFAAASTSARDLVTGHEDQVKASLDHFASAAANLDRLSSRLDSLRASLQASAGKVDRGEGSLGKLVNDERLYAELSSSVRDLRALIADLKANPRKYLKVSVF